MTKKELAITLSKLDVFTNAKINEEQYPTDSEIAGDILWFAMMNGDIEDKTVADLGAGTGILGIGSIILGSKTVFFVEKDADAITVLKKNLEQCYITTGFDIIHADIKDFIKKVDVVIQNPPFGTKETHADSIFLEKAMNIGKVVYSFHKAETKQYIDKFIRERAWTQTHYFEFKFPLKHSMKQHTKKVERINVGCWRIEKK